MHPAKETDKAVVERARRALNVRWMFRWGMLCYAVMFLGFSGFFTLRTIRKLEGLTAEQLNEGFIFGAALAVVWSSSGVLGGLCLAKFLTGFTADFRTQELLVRYHDRLRDLGDSVGEGSGKPASSASGSQPSDSRATGTSSSAGP